MALRSLLRRIPGPVLLSPSGPRMGPGHGVSPAAASRFMATNSQGGPRKAAEVHEDLGSNKLHEELDEINKIAWVRLAEHKKAVDKLRKVGNATLAVVVAIPVLLIFGSKYEA